jgi:hypothetical protein
MKTRFCIIVIQIILTYKIRESLIKEMEFSSAIGMMECWEYWNNFLKGKNKKSSTYC